MSGRYTFVAGNNGTASEMNTYVMDGIVYKEQVGTITVAMTAGGSWSTGSTNITGLTGFTVTPYIFVTGSSDQGTGLVAAHAFATSTSAFTLYAFYGGNSGTARVYRWRAVQATPTTAAGS
jgi:hypothetical protein